MRNQKKPRRFARLGLLLLLALGILSQWPRIDRFLGEQRVRRLGLVEMPAWVDRQLIEVDGSSRRGTPLEDIQNIVIHYVGNPGTSARQNRNWYANPESEVSSHFLVGLEGEVILCVPITEMSSASNHRNRDTISIEVCHPDESGRFTDTTYDSLVKLTAWLLDVCYLEAEDVIRHYDITGKECPRYYVRNEDSWKQFLDDVKQAAP